MSWGKTDTLADKPKYLTRPLSFDASSEDVVDVTANTIVVPNHGIITGDVITYTNGGGTAIVGLTTATEYYAIRVDRNTLKLATSSVNAVAGTAVDLTGLGVGTSHTVQKSLPDVLFVDISEAKQPENKAKGLTSPGWWRYKTYTDSNNIVRHKAELLVSVPVTAAVSGDAADDAILVDGTITIGTQPINALILTTDTGTFVVEATASPATSLSYQWQISTDGGTTFANVTDAGIYSGSTTDTLTITEPTVGEDGYKFKVVVSATGYTSKTSSVVTLSVE